MYGSWESAVYGGNKLDAKGQVEERQKPCKVLINKTNKLILHKIRLTYNLQKWIGRNSDNQKTFLSTFIIDITSSFYTSDTIRFDFKDFCLSPIFQKLNNIDDPNLMWYTIFVIGYRLRSLRFVRGGETNEPYT